MDTFEQPSPANNFKEVGYARMQLANFLPLRSRACHNSSLTAAQRPCTHTHAAYAASLTTVPRAVCTLVSGKAAVVLGWSAERFGVALWGCKASASAHHTRRVTPERGCRTRSQTNTSARNACSAMVRACWRQRSAHVYARVCVSAQIPRFRCI